MRILVVGASGYVGGRLVPLLAARGHELVLMSRDARPLAARFAHATVVAADLLDPSTLPVALERVDVTYYLAHSMGAGERGFADRDRQAARNFAQAAKGAGVSRIIYLGGLGDDSADLSHHLASRHETGAQLAAHGVPVTEFRAAVIIGSGSASFEILRHLTERLPIMITPRWVGTRCQPIGIADVLDYLVGALDHPEVTGVVEVGGPDILSYGDMMRAYARLRGLRRLMIPVPVLTPRLSSYWVNLISPVPAGIARPLIEGLRNEVVVQRSRPGRRVRPPPTLLRRGARGGDRSSRPPRRRVHVVRRARRVGSGDPLVGHRQRGDDRRASGAGRRRACRSGCSPRWSVSAAMRAGRLRTSSGGSGASWIAWSAASGCASDDATPTISGSATRSTSGGWRSSAGRACSAYGRR